MADSTLGDQLDYEELPEIWDWAQIRNAHVKGSFAQEVVDAIRLREILLHHLGQIEDDLRAPVKAAVEFVASEKEPPILAPH
ncbi:MAG: hypothetical protein M3331_03870, partial [Actinomycetota bacterium]|nr:hypothetical protein [Actinomycetota bacterium]